MIAQIRVYESDYSDDIVICVYNDKGLYLKIKPNKRCMQISEDIQKIIKVLGIPYSYKKVSYDYLDLDMRGTRKAEKGKCECANNSNVALIGYDFRTTKEYTFIFLINNTKHIYHTWSYNKSDKIGLSAETTELLLNMFGFDIKFQGNKTIAQCSYPYLTGSRV